jgi:hypothetical protein
MSGHITTIDLVRRAPERARPTRLSTALFLFKTNVFRARRLLGDLANGAKALSRGDAADFPVEIAASRTPLWPDPAPGETHLQRGKVHNLRIAARRLDRAVLAPGAVFSFWKELGPPLRARGFVSGRMLQEGCLVPATGGGLCQLSNALYDAALKAGCEIVERHAHSRLVPGSAAARGRDATVAWNYVDLRFKSARPLLLRVSLTRGTLIVGFHGVRDDGMQAERATAFDSAPRFAAQSCASCDETSCFRHETPTVRRAGATAFLVDEYWPEFDACIARERTAADTLCLPLDGKRWNRAQYGWRTDGFARVESAAIATLLRSAASRRLAAQGAVRQTALLDASERLAMRYVRALDENTTSVTLPQTLLPFLWRDGHLGGRRFTVLMTRLPMGALQARLDAAAALHPESKTLSDFRAPAELVALEHNALAAADAIVTPHAEIAALFGDRAVLLPWQMPPQTNNARKRRRMIAFPGPTVARKGAFELREALRRLNCELVLLGSELEGADFWRGVRTRRPDSNDWLSEVAAVVQAAFVEDRPRKLLAALASGVPVIATAACGIAPRQGLTLVPAGDTDALAAAIAAVLPK